MDFFFSSFRKGCEQTRSWGKIWLYRPVFITISTRETTVTIQTHYRGPSLLWTTFFVSSRKYERRMLTLFPKEGKKRKKEKHRCRREGRDKDLRFSVPSIHFPSTVFMSVNLVCLLVFVHWGWSCFQKKKKTFNIYDTKNSGEKKGGKPRGYFLMTMWWIDDTYNSP